MFKVFILACFLALVAAKPGVFPADYSAAYIAPEAAAYSAPVAYSAYSAYSAPLAYSAYSAYLYAAPYSAYYLRR